MVASGTLVALVLARTGGTLVFVIDDPAIHFGLARHLVEHGTWGVSPGVYESASSSPGWTLLMALPVAVARPLVPWTAFGVNVLAGAGIAWLLGSGQRLVHVRWGAWSSALAAVVLPVVAFALPVLALTGMEHSLHALLVLVALLLLDRMAIGDGDRRTAVGFVAALALAALFRFETMFVALGVAAGIAAAGTWRGPDRLRLGAAALAGVFLPVGALMAVNVGFGQDPLPNSIVAKTSLNGSDGLLPPWHELLEAFARDPLLSAYLVLAIAYVVLRRSLAAQHVALATAFLVAGSLHLVFANLGWWERYQAYLVIAGTFVILTIGAEVLRARWREPAVAILVVAVVLLSSHRVHGLHLAPLGASNTFRQQQQLGRFLERYEEGTAVAVDDLGYASYGHDGPIIDLVGLGSREVLQARRAGRFDRTFVQRLFEEEAVAVVAVHASLYRSVLPEDWLAVGVWGLGQQRVSPPEDELTFFARQDGASDLEADLRRFEASLPEGVTVRYPLHDQVARLREVA